MLDELHGITFSQSSGNSNWRAKNPYFKGFLALVFIFRSKYAAIIMVLFNNSFFE